jgi:hypothetical protein
LLTLVAQRFSAQAPVATILRWAEELSEVSDDGVTLLDATFPLTVDVEADAQAEPFLAAFRHFVKREKKLPPQLRGLSAADLRQLRAVFAQSALSVLL